jgi:hypothetical protein
MMPQASMFLPAPAQRQHAVPTAGPRHVEFIPMVPRLMHRIRDPDIDAERRYRMDRIPSDVSSQPEGAQPTNLDFQNDTLPEQFAHSLRMKDHGKERAHSSSNGPSRRPKNPQRGHNRK